MIQNERGIALVITLLIVALLTITVVEFTYSVEVDQRMARNSLDGLQASLLARSGVVFGEAVLLHDDEPKFDAFTEKWCTDNDGQPTNGEFPSCDFEPDAKLGLPGDTGLRVRVLDESGKFNLNLARPQNQLECSILANPDAHPQAALQLRVNALGRLLEARGIGPEVLESFEAYWRQMCDSIVSSFGGQVPGTPGVTNPAAVPPANQAQLINQELRAREFASLDDASVVPGFDAGVIRRLRPMLAATSGTALTVVNVNTAPREVLRAILGGVEGGADAADEIISQRGDQPFQQLPASASSLSGKTGNMLGVRSSCFLIRASAVVKRNPMTLRGGIGRTASMLVQRLPRLGVAQRNPTGTSPWTLTRLDWQKEGGAALFRKTDLPAGAEDPSSMSPEG